MTTKNYKTDIFRNLDPDDEPLAIQCESSSDCSSYSSLAWRFNCREGKKRQKYIHVSIDYYNAMIWFVCVSWDYHEKEINREVPPLDWRKKLIQKKTRLSQ